MNEPMDLFDLLISGADLPDINTTPVEDEAMLGNQKCGDIVTIGNRQYIVLEQTCVGTAVITKDLVKQMAFGRNADYANSDIRRWCNTEFYSELADAVGEENIVKHTIDLTADDGTGKDAFVEDYVSILTTEMYRRYRESLPAYGKWWYTATRTNADNDAYARYVCYVRSNGVLGWGDCDSDDGGVRPFCILKSCVVSSHS